MTIDKEFYLRLRDNKSLIVSPDDDDVVLSVHVPGGHMMVTLTWDQGLDLLEALRIILETQDA